MTSKVTFCTAKSAPLVQVMYEKLSIRMRPSRMRRVAFGARVKNIGELRKVGAATRDISQLEGIFT
jgi:hypothetical protein